MKRYVVQIGTVSNGKLFIYNVTVDAFDYEQAIVAAKELVIEKEPYIPREELYEVMSNPIEFN